MRIVIIEFISLDGVVQAPGGPRRTRTAASPTAAGRSRSSTRPWAARLNDALTKAEPCCSAAARGRRWRRRGPERAGDPFADRMNSIPKYVVSATLGNDELTWNNTTRIPGDEAVGRHPGAAGATAATSSSWAARRSRARS